MRRIIILSFFICNNLMAQNQSSVTPFSSSFITVPKKCQKENVYHIQNRSQHFSALNLMGQSMAGIAGGFLLALPTYYLARTDNNHGTNTGTYLTIFSFISYLIGSAKGVNIVAGIENPEISFWETAGYSAIGGSIGLIVLGKTFDGDDLWPGAIILGLVLPTFTSMIYSEFVADWHDETKNLNLQPKLESHKDLIEQSKLFNIELLRIYF